jgi:hypothetical protein
VANLLLRRMGLLTVALVLGSVAVQADTFRHSSDMQAFGSAPVFSRPAVTVQKVTGIQAIVEEFQAKQAKPAYGAQSEESSRTQRSGRDTSALYATAVYLAAQMVGVDASTSFGRQQSSVVNSAIWNLFTRPASNVFGTKKSQNDGVLRFWGNARKGSEGAGGLANINIWKPWQKGPKESVPVPEGSLLSQLAFDVLVLAGLGFCVRRRGVTLAS